MILVVPVVSWDDVVEVPREPVATLDAAVVVAEDVADVIELVAIDEE